MFDDGKLLKPDELNDKILGIICGLYVSKNKSAIEQLGIILNMTIIGKDINSKNFMELFKDGKHCIDDHSKDVLNETDFDINNIKASYSCIRRKMLLKETGHIREYPMLRIPFLGIYKDWRTMTVDMCCATHFDEECISSCWVMNSFIRAQACGYGDDMSVEQIKEESIDYIMFGGKMVDKEKIDGLMYYTNKDVYTSIDKIFEKEGHNVYKVLSLVMYSLVECKKDKVYENIINKVSASIKEKYDEEQFNNVLCIISSVIGCYLGYNRMPHQDNLDIEPKIKHILKGMSLVKDKTDSLDDICKDGYIDFEKTKQEYMKILKSREDKKQAEIKKVQDLFNKSNNKNEE